MASRTIADNSSESGGRVDNQIVEEEDSSSPPITPDDEHAEWIGELELEMEQEFTWQLLPPQPEEETESVISEFPWQRELFRPAVVRGWNFSTPVVVAIGPFHRKERLHISDNNKRAIVNLMKEFYNLDSEGCLSKMKNQVANACKRYFELDTPQRINSEEDKSFAEMLLLDSCFILFMLTIKIEERLPYYKLIPTAPDSVRMMLRDGTTKVLDCILNKDSIAPDLLILSNQIPFFVIEELFKELKLEKPLHKYALEYFETIHPLSIQGRPIEERTDQNSPPKFLHLLDLFHWSRVPKNKYKELISSSPENLHFIDEKSCHIPSAMELRQSATTFEKKMFGSSLDITFRKHRFIPIIRVLKIPELRIRSYSNLIFHNLIAFELQVSSKGCCTMAFAALMRNLLQSEEDVKLLQQHGILVISPTGDKEPFISFEYLNSLTENQQMPSDLSIICHQVQSYHDRAVSRFFRFPFVILRFFHFVTLWCFSNRLVTFSVFVAALSVVPTLLQAINSILNFIHR